MALQRILLPPYRLAARLLGDRGLDRFRVVRAVNRLVLREVGDTPALVEGSRLMYTDAADRLRLHAKGAYEPFQSDLARKELKPGDVVLDIGANIGYYTLLFASLVGESGRVYAFEPDPVNFEILRRNVDLNGYTNIVLSQSAVSDENGTLRLYLSADTADHRIFDGGEHRDSIEVPAIRLDEFLADVGEIAFVKMDIQGAEQYALDGMARVARRTRKLTSEFSPHLLVKAGTDPRGYVQNLRAAGFEVFELDKDRDRIVPLDLEDVLRRYPPDTFESFTNLYCVRRDGAAS